MNRCEAGEREFRVKGDRNARGRKKNSSSAAKSRFFGDQEAFRVEFREGFPLI
ncbi:hypothetical protein RSSM_05993 [Rhodopirellula sallentina SM41]|uniref:Uncharacterized protein n=1 Tax=Rhodopirellula sallentina SM41 TaxID=1263870 RepID=M5TTS3_9BACT|nr:hypothetical protein RSSM_05993 [Rhodopirellula sallentina SM41]